MHARELAELAALLAIHSSAVVHGAVGDACGMSEQYWSASKCRLDRWTRVLRQLTAAAGQPRLPATLAWARTGPVLEEILTTEILTRIWMALAVAHDAARGDENLSPPARNVLIGHLDARRRLLGLLAEGKVIALGHTVYLNQLRRRAERWTDMLLSHLAGSGEIEEFAFDAQRARDFAEDLDREASPAQRRLTCQLVLTSLRASFSSGLTDRPPSADLNRRIASALLGGFGEYLTDSTTLVKSLWLERLNRTAIDTEDMVEELLRLETS